MKASTMARALRAAARLAVGVSWCGACGGSLGVQAEGDAEPAATRDGNAPPRDALASVAAETGTAPLQEADAKPSPKQAPADAAPLDAELACALTFDPDGGLAGSSVDCCMALTLSMLPDSGASIDAGSWKADPSLASCCGALQASGFLSAPAYTARHWTEAACAACSQVTGVDGTLCIPWGPPVPPAMPDAMELA
jgi:hypothetical protein